MEKKTPLTIGKRNLDAPNHWQELDLSSYKITKPTVICLGGNFTKKSREANNMCKIAESLLGLKRQISDERATYNDVDLVGVAYGEIEGKSASSSTAVTMLEVAEMVDSLLLPLAVNDQGERLSMEEAQRNFCNVNFFSHCYGATVINSMIFDLGRKMLALGYQSSEILNIEGQMTSVSYAPTAEVYNMPSFQVVSARDGVSMVPTGASKHFNDLFFDVFEGRKVFSGNYLFKEDENTVTLYTSNMSSLPTNEHLISLLGRSEFWRYNTLNADNADGVSQATAYALATAVATGVKNQINDSFDPKPTVDEMFEGCKSVLSGFKQATFQDVEQ